jgi:hypothetical protein
VIRKLLCRDCGDKAALDPQDAAMGWKFRKVVVGASSVPADHGIRTISETESKFHPIADLVCDNCSAIITASVLVATTMWRPERDGVPRDWESKFGQVLPPEAVRVNDALIERKSNDKRSKRH